MAIQTINSKISQKTKDRLTVAACYLIPFLGLGGYLLSLIVQNSIPPSEGYYLIHYLYTYDHGFVARGLVGEMLSWFFESVSDKLTQNVIILFSFLLMISAALCIGKALSKLRSNPRLFCVAAVISLLICVMPATFRYYYTDIKLDKILWALTLFAVLLVDKKLGIWFVPFFCLAATLVNPIFLFCSMILVSIMLLQEFHSNNYSVKNGIICAVSYVSMIILGVYALASEKYLGFATPQELVDFYFARYSGTLDEESYHLFATEWLFDYFQPMEEIVRTAFRIYFVEWGNWKTCLFDTIFLMIPAYTVTTLFWKSCMAESENKFQKFIFFLCLISPVVIILPIVFSWESSKYFYNNLIVHLALVIYFIVSGNSCVVSAINKAGIWVKNHLAASICMLSYFMAFVFI